MTTIGPGEMMVRSYSSLSALVFLAWDLVVAFEDEYEYIWKRNWTPVKCIYLFCRYFALAAQIIGCIITRGPISQVPVAFTVCQAWFTFQGVCISSLICSVNTVLMLRVYALYGQSRNVAIFLAILFFVDITSLSAQGYICVKRSVYDQACVVREVPSVVVSFSMEVLAVQGILWGMTWWRTSRSETWSRTPLVSLVARHGAIVFVGTFAVLVVSLPYAVLVRAVGHIVFPWFISLLSFAACRLTINLLRLDTTGASTQGGLELTTFIEISLGDQLTAPRIATATQP